MAMANSQITDTELSALQTEQVADPSLALDQMDSTRVVDTLVRSQITALENTAREADSIAKAVDAAADRLSQSGHGRLVMLGAGASGRLAVQDGAELWPTFGWPHERLILNIAGGEQALLRSLEGAEDDIELACRECADNSIGPLDVVLGVAASGRSPYTVHWIKQARQVGALTIAFSNNEGSPLLDNAEYKVVLRSGAEVLAGSTRLAAGTAQKAALNAFSTALMVRLNRTWGQLMVDMAAKNTKLHSRRRAMLAQIHPGLSQARANAALTEAGGWVKLAALLSFGLEKPDALQLLERYDGSLRHALEHLDNV